ncbi:DAHL domain-containing protein [Massilia cavernae]|uniref:Sensor domain-containing diguanylate cyclase n=1 Tax=Massilia cavernae TaxID=2320864 RepID=A0A418XQL5_9BURK|nr:DAHL domain-containing protein [Massilia cavernae]RJG14737.1 sensor domain-containing diguanylate cyclase [Massilia cavernae]
MKGISPRRLAVIALLVALTAMLGYLFNRTQATDIEAQNRVMLTLRELEKLDAEWTVNILRLHVGLNPDYASLSAPLPRMRELQQQLAEALPLSPGPETRTAYTDMARRLRDKATLAEEFKMQNSRLRSSLSYFPPAITALKAEVTGIGGATAPARTVLALDGALNALMTDILRYNLAPAPELARSIEQDIALAVSLKGPFPQSIRDAIDDVAVHARLILRHRQHENALDARIAALGTAAAMDRLGRLFDRAFDQGIIEKQRFRTFLFIYSGLLLLLLIYAARRLRRSYTIIGVVNRSLQAANATLEQRVAERTAELEAQAEQLKQLADHDSLTGLINYGQFSRLLDLALVRAARRGNIVVVMFIDLDGFKAVNDTWGHAAGDMVLKEVASRVKALLRKEDVLARLGGDEFVILLEEVKGREGAGRVAQLALDAVRGITEVDGHLVRISASIGIGATCGGIVTPEAGETLLAEADQAMYSAKQAGKSRFVFSPGAQWDSCPAPRTAARQPGARSG